MTPMTSASAMRVAILQFPASNCDQDCVHALRVLGAKAKLVWHKDTHLGEVDAVIVPGGFSYGDALRCGAIARFSPVMQAVSRFADNGGLVLGICNGFQILCESGLLPGALIRNNHLHFICRDQRVRIEAGDTAWTADFAAGQEIVIPVKNGEGGYVADARTLDMLQAEDRIVARYQGNPNGSLRDIAAITNESRTVVGIMPHPEHAIDPLTGPTADGLAFFTSIVTTLAARVGA